MYGALEQLPTILYAHMHCDNFDGESLPTDRPVPRSDILSDIEMIDLLKN